MKKLLAVLLLSASAFAQTKESLEQRVSPKPSGTAGDIPYAVNTTTIGWIPHATGLQCLTQNGSATPVWGACSAGTSPLTTKGDLYTFSTLDVRLPVGTNGYVLEPDSTQATGLKWVDPNVSSTGWVKLQASYPGSQQTGSFNVSGSSGSGPYTAAYTTVSGSPGTYDLLRVFYDTAGVAGDRYRILFGSSGDTAKQLALSYYNPASGGGEQPSWTFHAVSLSEGNGVTLFKKGSLTQLCVDTDGTSASGYPTICNGGDAFNVGYVSGAGPALQINGTGDIVKIRNVVYAWPSSAAAAATCLRRDAVGNLSWDTACGVGGTGGVTSVALSLPSIFAVTGSPVTSTGTLTGAFNTQTQNLIFAGPASGVAATPTFRALVSLDIPNNAADTTGKSATTDALNTTTTAVNVSLSAAPGGAGYACITTDPTHCTWQTVTGTGTVTNIATTAPITGGPITATGTIAITSFATSAPSPGAVPDATGASAGSYLDKSGTWTVPSGGSGYGGTVWILADPNFSTGSSYERVQTNYLGGAPGMVQLAPARTYATAVANAKTSPSAPWAWNNTTHVVSADENTTVASALYISWDVTNNYDWIVGTTTASTLTKNYPGQYQEWIFRFASAAYTTAAKGSGFVVYNNGNNNEFYRVNLGGSSGTVGSLAFYDGTLSNSIATTQTQNTNGIWVKVIRSGTNITGFYNLTNQSNPPTTWTAGGGGIKVSTSNVLAGFLAARFNSTGASNLSVLYFDDSRSNMGPNWEVASFPVTAAQGFDSASPILTLVGGFDLGASGATVTDANVRLALAEITNPREWDAAAWTWSVSRDSSVPVACGGGSYAAAASVSVGGTGRYISVCGKAASTGHIQPGSVSSATLRIPFTP